MFGSARRDRVQSYKMDADLMGLLHRHNIPMIWNVSRQKARSLKCCALSCSSAIDLSDQKAIHSFMLHDSATQANTG